MALPKDAVLLLIDKKADMTSFDCIRELRRLLDRRDLGHAGTLDRFATGLLPIFFGEGLKLTRFFLESYPELPSYWKTYEGIVKLGTATETGDPEGAVIETKPVPQLTVEQVQEAMQGFTEQPYLQTPPAFSAKKIDGRRASELAREGETVELKPVKVQVKKLECLGVDGDLLRLRAVCSKGTYVRVLAQDLAMKLGTAGHLVELRRTAIGAFSVDEAVQIDSLTKETVNSHAKSLAEAVCFLPQFPLLGPDEANIRLGRTADVCARLANSNLAPNVYCAITQTGSEIPKPVGIFSLDSQHRAQFIRGLIT